MSQMQLLEWIGGLDEDLLERSELPMIKRKKPRLISWVATAACLCLICGLAWGLNGGRKVAMDNATGGTPMEGDGYSGVLSDDMESSDRDEQIHFSESDKTERPILGEVNDICQNQSYWAQHSLAQAKEPEVTVFFSRQELDAWLESHPELTGYDREAVLQLCQKYGESYFTKQALLLTRIGGADSQTDYAEKGFLHKVAGKLETDWMLYLFGKEPEGGLHAEGCRYVFSEADPDCAIEPEDTVGVQLIPWEEAPKF